MNQDENLKDYEIIHQGLNDLKEIISLLEAKGKDINEDINIEGKACLSKIESASKKVIEQIDLKLELLNKNNEILKNNIDIVNDRIAEIRRLLPPSPKVTFSGYKKLEDILKMGNSIKNLKLQKETYSADFYLKIITWDKDSVYIERYDENGLYDKNKTLSRKSNTKLKIMKN